MKEAVLAAAGNANIYSSSTESSMLIMHKRQQSSAPAQHSVSALWVVVGQNTQLCAALQQGGKQQEGCR